MDDVSSLRYFVLGLGERGVHGGVSKMNGCYGRRGMHLNKVLEKGLIKIGENVRFNWGRWNVLILSVVMSE